MPLVIAAPIILEVNEIGAAGMMRKGKIKTQGQVDLSPSSGSLHL